MTIPLRWAPGDQAVVRVTVDRAVDTDGDVRVEVDDGGTRGARVYVDACKLQLPPLVADDQRVVELVAAVREMVRWDWLHLLADDKSQSAEVYDDYRRLASALAALKERT